MRNIRFLLVALVILPLLAAAQDEARLHVGAKVEHESFGRGRVVGLTGKGEQARAIVDFESVGRKQLMLKFAHLRLL